MHRRMSTGVDNSLIKARWLPQLGWPETEHRLNPAWHFPEYPFQSCWGYEALWGLCEDRESEKCTAGPDSCFVRELAFPTVHRGASKRPLDCFSISSSGQKGGLANVLRHH